MTVLSMNILRARSKVQCVSNVRNINLTNLGLSDVTIVNQMPYIEVMILNCNCITSLKYFTNCIYLRELQLNNNFILDIKEFEALKSLADLRYLAVANNLFIDSLVESHRIALLRVIPQLTKIDGVEVTEEEREASKRPLLIEAKKSPESVKEEVKEEPETKKEESIIEVKEPSEPKSKDVAISARSEKVSHATSEPFIKCPRIIPNIDIPHDENIILLSVARCIVAKLDYDSLIALERAIRQQVEKEVLRRFEVQHK